MFGQTVAIIRNTFFESIRQPIMLVVLVIATIALVFSNLLAGFTMEDDQRMMVDLGLSTVFICGALLAAFISTNVLNLEIENRTVLTVISKPVSRPIFVLGKYLGAAGALALATTYMSFVFLLVELHGVLQTVRDPIHWPVILFGSAVLLAGVVAAGWCNYFYGRVFASTVLAITTPLVALAYFMSLLFDPDFLLRPGGEAFSVAFKGQLWLALTAIIMAVLVLTSIAIAASTRLGQVMTLCVTLGVFLLGMLSDWIFGRKIQRIESLWLQRASAKGLTETIQQTRIIELVTGEIPPPTIVDIEVPTAGVELTQMAHGLGERLEHAAYWVAYAIVPNFQVFWLSDTINQDHVIPTDYMMVMLVYGPVQILVALGLATILFQRREVG